MDQRKVKVNDKRPSFWQQTMLLEFMESHDQIAEGRTSEFYSLADKDKDAVELASVLNSDLDNAQKTAAGWIQVKIVFF